MVRDGDVAGKRLLILDGSRLSLEVIEHARKMGVETVVTDWNVQADSPAKQAADEHHQVSIAEVDEVVDLIKKESIDGVLTGYSDRWLPTYARICNQAGLPAYASEEQLELFTDKTRYLDLLEEHGVPTIRRFTVEDAQAGTIPREAYPLIVKPADGSGSRGIEICDSPEDLETVVARAQRSALAGGVVIERYLPGQEATAYWVFAAGEFHVAMVANRHMTGVPGTDKRLPVGYSAPSAIAPSYTRSIAPNVRNALAAAGVKDGVMFMQGLVHGGVFYTYDIGYRLTATQEYRVLDHYQGYNPMEMMIHYALTGSMGADNLGEKVDPVEQGYSYNVSTLMLPGTVDSVTGTPAEGPATGVLSSSPAHLPGETLPEAALGELRQIAHRTTGVCTSRQNTADTMERLGREIEFVSDDGVVLSLPGPVAEEVVEVLL